MPSSLPTESNLGYLMAKDEEVRAGLRLGHSNVNLYSKTNAYLILLEVNGLLKMEMRWNVRLLEETKEAGHL